jgi:hypothetical protein
VFQLSRRPRKIHPSGATARPCQLATDDTSYRSDDVTRGRGVQPTATSRPLYGQVESPVRELKSDPSTGQLLRTYFLSVRQQRCNSIKLLKPRHDRRTGPKPNPAGFQHFCRMSCLSKELDQQCSTIDANRLTGDPLVPRRDRGNVGIPKGFAKSVGRVGSRHHGPPCFPYSVISMVCFSSGDAG